ncbi:MAG: hypothetical protein ACK40O_05370, partial [Allosphingosinicella sp.]
VAPIARSSARSSSVPPGPMATAPVMPRLPASLRSVAAVPAERPRPRAAPDPLAAALAEVDADALTPREALDLVYRLKRLAEEAEG